MCTPILPSGYGRSGVVAARTWPPNRLEPDHYILLRGLPARYPICCVQGAPVRDTRATYRREENDDTPGTVTIGTLTYAGSGWLTEGDALLANTAAAQRRQARRIGREELAHEAWLTGAAA